MKRKPSSLTRKTLSPNERRNSGQARGSAVLRRARARLGVGWVLVGVGVLGAGTALWLTRNSPWGQTGDGVAIEAPTRSSRTLPGTSLSETEGAKESVVVDRISRANQWVAKGEFDKAVEMLREAEKASPKDEDVHYNLGIALAKLGRNEEAAKHYEEALRIFPDYAEAHNNLGNLLLRTGQRIEALKHFEQAVKITPEYASAWNNFGTALTQMGRTNEAFGYFEEAVRLDTNYWQARFNLGTSHAEHGRLDEARLEFQAVLRLQPDFTPARVALTQIEGAQEATPE